MNVSITDGVRHYRTPDPSNELATNMLDKQREEVQRAISRQLEGSVTSGSFSGFLANAVSNFAQTRGVEQRQIELLERLEDTMDDVASNTEVLRDITGLTFTGEA